MITLSAQAAFVSGITSAQIRAEIDVQPAVGANAAAIVSKAVAAGLNISSLIEVLVTVSGINRSVAVGAAVRATPAAAAAIASAATTAAPQAAMALATAAATAMPPSSRRFATAAEPAPVLVLPLPTNTPTTQTVCSVSCS